MLNFKNVTVVVFLLSLVSITYGQKGTQSPYSSFGIGELNNDGYAAFSSMGGISMGNTDSTIVNSMNPASYSYIGRNMPVFQLGMNGRFSSFSTETSASNQRHFGLNQFQLGLPIKKNWGAAIGIKPYSFTGYTITNYTIEDEDTTRQFVNEGSGGVRIVNFGLSYRPMNKRKNDSIPRVYRDTAGVKYTAYIQGTKKSNLSFGINGNYLFGTSKQIRSTEFIPSTASTFNARVTNGLRVSGLAMEVGLLYEFAFTSSNFSRGLSLGTTYSPASNVRAFQDIEAVSYVGSFYRGQNVAILDTTQLTQDNQGSISKPDTYVFGIEYRVSPFNTGSMIRIGAELKNEKWSTFSTNFSGVETAGGLKDRLTYRVGLEWVPKAGISSFDKTTSFLSKIRYRIGFNYAQTELLVKNNLGDEVEIDNYGMSFGLGIPILTGNSNTNLNFGASLGSLGTTDGGLIQERYVGLFVGFSITPQRSNRWFVKRKYN